MARANSMGVAMKYFLGKIASKVTKGREDGMKGNGRTWCQEKAESEFGGQGLRPVPWGSAKLIYALRYIQRHCGGGGCGGIAADRDWAIWEPAGTRDRYGCAESGYRSGFGACDVWDHSDADDYGERGGGIGGFKYQRAVGYFGDGSAGGSAFAEVGNYRWELGEESESVSFFLKLNTNAGRHLLGGPSGVIVNLRG
jgi:hypothetical protein